LKDFSAILLEWHGNNPRHLPWKKDKDPYKIWLSEIILQQTRVDQGTPYFFKFLEHFPTVHDLAEASEDRVLKLWEGLGYYSRAKNLHFTAKSIVSERAGNFPNSYEDLLELKGVGKYTAAAIASFAFDLPHAVVDGNVLRVLTRYFGITTPVDSSKGIRKIEEIAQKLLNGNSPAAFNQAIMDFGSTVCTPKKPLCPNCPFQGSCKSYQSEEGPLFYPVKEKKIQKRDLYLYYLVILNGEEIAIRKRTEKEIWPNLYEFYLIEKGEIKKEPMSLIRDFKAIQVSKPYKHQLTHRNLEITFIQCDWSGSTVELPEGMFFTKNLSKFAFPKVLDLYIKDNF
jgi:A/G-specific adenine glycosylase